MSNEPKEHSSGFMAQDRTKVDLIYRQAAIRETWREPTYSDPLNVMTEMRDRIEALPSAQPEIKCIAKIMLTEEQVQEAFEKAKKEILAAQPERKVGKWIIVTDSRGRHAECPYCGEWKYHSNQKFCGECGARIEEEER